MNTDFYAAATDVGKVREHNEDNFADCPELGLWIVADGMGGHEAGEVASAIAVEVIPAEVAGGSTLVKAIAKAHNAIIQAGCDGRGSPGMGCTVVVLKLDGCAYQIAWVGDSRGYLWNSERLTPLTRDHSFVQQLIDGGALSEEEARVHPQRSVITQALGVADGISVDSVSGQLAKGESILLCSDGLTGEVDDRHITALLGGGDVHQQPRQQVKRLIAAANDNGGSDNITVILVNAPDDAEKRDPTVPLGSTVPFDAAALNAALNVAQGQKRKKLWMRLALAAVLLVVLCGLFFCSGHSSDPKVMVGGAGGGVVLTVAPIVDPVVESVAEVKTLLSPLAAEVLQLDEEENIPEVQMSAPLPRMGEGGVGGETAVAIAPTSLVLPRVGDSHDKSESLVLKEME